MKTIILITLCLAALFFSSCENKERLEEIKAMLKGSRKVSNSEKKNVYFSAPSQNQKVEENYNSDYESGEGGDEYSENYNSYPEESNYNDYSEEDSEENVEDY